MQPQLPSFQSFLALSRNASSPAMVVGLQALTPPPVLHKRKYPLYERHNEYRYTRYQPTAPRMCQLASLMAREYGVSMQSHTVPVAGSASPCCSPSPCCSSSASPGGRSSFSEASEPYSDEDRSPPARTNTAQVKAHMASSGHCNKKKYLKEVQRYEIVRRVRSGEKQAHLAKEFGVSRAAVCYLLKHQNEILNRSIDSRGGPSQCA